MAEEHKEILIDYDKEEDILSLSREGVKVKFSIDIELPKGDFIVDYGFNGQIAGIEFFNASSYFPMLKNISDISKIRASMSVQYGSNWAQIAYSLYLPDVKEPIVNYINAPYNRRLILEN